MLAASPRFQAGSQRHLMRVADDPSRCASALHAAARSGDVRGLNRVLASGASPNERAGDRRGPLHAASQAGSLDAVATLLRAGADINMRSLWDITPLLEAAAEGHVAVTKLLLTAGGDPTAAGRDGFSALHKAAEMGHVGVVELLLHVMPDADTRNAWGYTPLIAAACKGHTAVVKALLAAGADPNVAVNHSAGVVTPLEGAVLQDYAGAARVLLEFGADPNHANPATGETPLHLACSHFSRRCIRVLLEFGADEHTRSGRNNNGEGEPPAAVLGRNLRTTHQVEEMQQMRDEIKGLLASAPKIRRDARWARRGWLVSLRALRLQSRLKLSGSCSQQQQQQQQRQQQQQEQQRQQQQNHKIRSASVPIPSASSPQSALSPSAITPLGSWEAPLSQELRGEFSASADRSSSSAQKPEMAPAFTVFERPAVELSAGSRRRQLPTAVALERAAAAARVAVRLDDDELFSLVVTFL